MQPETTLNSIIKFSVNFEIYIYFSHLFVDMFN